MRLLCSGHRHFDSYADFRVTSTDRIVGDKLNFVLCIPTSMRLGEKRFSN